MDYYTIISLSFLLVLLRILYSYLNKPFSYWRELGVAEVPGVPIVGSMWKNITGNDAHIQEVEKHKKYGRLHGYYEGSTPVLHVGEPALLRDILVKDFNVFPGFRVFPESDPLISNMVFNLRGEDWKRVRTIITPAFSTGKMKKMFSIIYDSVATLSTHFLKKTKSGEPLDIRRLYGGFTMDVIASCAFGTKIDSNNDPENPFVYAAKRAFVPDESWKIKLFSLFPTLGRLLGSTRFESDSIKFFKEATLQIIEERINSPAKRRNDLLQILMDAAEEAKKGKVIQDKDDLEENEKVSNDENMSKIVSKGLSYDELIANCIMFLLGGYETTASTISFASYLLALNPSCQEKLIKEIDECIQQNQDKLNYEAMHDMKYLDMVISETLRIYPAGFRTERMAQEDYKLGDTGITVKKGMTVSVPIYALHHDPDFFPEPQKFNPLRFSPEEKSNQVAYTYLPFGDGPRVCLGMRFAHIQIKICLAYLLSQFRFMRCSETKVPLEFDTGRGLLQPKSVVLEVEERTDKIYNP